MGNKKILVIAAYAGIGDFFLSLPMFETLHQQYNTKFDILVRSDARFLPFIRTVDLFSHVYIYDRKGKHSSFSAQFRLLRRLRRQNYEIGFTLHPGKRYVLMLYLSGAEIRVGGYEYSFLKYFLTHPVPDLKADPIFFRKFQAGEVHGLDCFFYFLDCLGLKYERKKPVVSLGEIEKSAAILISGLNKPLIGINTGSSGEAKNWPLENFLALAENLKKEKKASLIFFGGPGEADKFSVFKSRFPADLYAIGNDFPILLNTALLKKCDLLISNDTGLVHIASFFDLPVISIGGGARTGKAFLAWSKKSRNLLESVDCNLLCRECGNCACVKNIRVESVLKAVDELLS
ncbi:MAG: glycosyltransferase family 9 protein [Candidatus Wallbacteria bacterium]|nr:glycosyltransferase family 9 protein [Candidatus Wallbacteria bacterium]